MSAAAKCVYLVGEKYQILPGRDYTVGRKDCDIVINGDQSISRKHAVLSVQFSEDKKEQYVLLKDLSKFGTAVGSSRLDGNGSQMVIKHAEQIIFGTADSIYRLERERFVIVTSSLDGAAKKELKSLVAAVGGVLVNDWQNDCRLVIMSSLTVTVKVICALLTQTPIVTIQYLKDYTACLSSGSPVPEPSGYLPLLADSQVDSSRVSFHPNAARAHIFKGKTFVFFSEKQLKRLASTIELGGGAVKVMGDEDDALLLHPHTCVMSGEPLSDDSMSVNIHDRVAHVTQLLRRKGRRLISDAEIGFAVLFCSTNHYCNPLSMAESSATVSSQMTAASFVTKDSLAPGVSTLPRVTAKPFSDSLNTAPVNGASVTAVEFVDDDIVEVDPVPERRCAVRDEGKAARVEASEASTPTFKPIVVVPESPLVPATKTKATAATAAVIQDIVDSKESLEIVMTTSPVRPQAMRKIRDSLQTTMKQFNWNNNCSDLVDNKEAVQASLGLGNKIQPPLLASAASLSHVKPESKASTTGAAADVWAFPKSSSRSRLLTARASNQQLQREEETEVAMSTAIDTPREQTGDADTDTRDSSSVVTVPSVIKREPGGNAVSLTEQQHKTNNVTALGKPIVANRAVDCSGGEFLSTSKQKMSRGEDEADDRDNKEIRGLTVVEERPLLARRCVDTAAGSGSHDAAVKNFKKFCKTRAHVAVGLPRIIGGRDLYVSETSASKSVRDLFEDQVKIDQQRLAAEKLAEDLFRWEPSKKKGRQH